MVGKVWWACCALGVSGCVPYVGYTHLSNPNIDNDGYDLVCGGVRNENIRVAACNNMNDGQGMVKVDLEYEL